MNSDQAESGGGGGLFDGPFRMRGAFQVEFDSVGRLKVRQEPFYVE